MKLRNFASWKFLNLYFYQQEAGQHFFFSKKKEFPSTFSKEPLVLDVKKQI